ncbi:putative timeless-domain-containing protein [Lyophyllum shimeji]|uniref:Timeless-domain-containing protein n=1 Tax=Lyophyllum shimeji TaxID=47721 RepID=A0A9P3PPD2_LYOSH|nr:putative timeless-domain-containing protein [Lyophyllum shimeji]
MAPHEILDLTVPDADLDPEHEPNPDTLPPLDRRLILQPVITRVVDALGGYDGPSSSYRLGDSVYGCLKDLKKLWRKDDTDDERTVARILWETRVLPNDLIPILLCTAGKGQVEDKRAVACVDLMTAMTWPIDLAEELKELDEEEIEDGVTPEYTVLLEAHLHYKAALVKGNAVMQALLGIVLPPLAKTPKERTERDAQVVSVVLHLLRNLAFIRDLPGDARRGSADHAQLAGLQTRLVRAMQETHVMQLLLTIAANTARDPVLDSWNTVVLEIFYLLFRGVRPGSLAVDQAKQPTETLHRLLAAEDRTRRELARTAASRHSRFGTTIAVKLNPAKKALPLPQAPSSATDSSSSTSSRAFVLHRQQAISREAGSVMDIGKKHNPGKRGTKVDELAREDNLSLEARTVLKGLAVEFLQACFNPYLNQLLKDIRSERAKITEKDHLRLLFVTKWFLEFFLAMRAKEKEGEKAGHGRGGGGEEQWGFGLVAEVTERTWIVWVLKRMREAVEEKPKAWTELQTGIECLTQLLLLIDAMSSSAIADPVLREAGEVLQQQLIYNGEVLDIAFESLRAYKTGTQSLAYLESSVYLAYALLRMLERWSKGMGGGGEVYVRQKRKARRKKGPAKGMGEEDGIPDVEDAGQEEKDEEEVHETMFSFEAFEMKFAHADITNTLLTYLARYKDFSSPEHMRRVVSLMHRQAVRAKAEGLFFKVSTLDLFKTILADQKTMPREQPYKDLINLITFISRQFFKALAEDPFLAVEAFFPKNRGHWKQFSSWEPEEKKGKREKKTVEDTRFPRDVEVKKGYSWSDQLGIAIAALVEAGEVEFVHWTKDILGLVIAQRKRIIEEADAKDDDAEDNDDDEDVEAAAAKLLRLKEPSAEAMAKITDYLVPYLSDEQADAATKNPKLKLLFRLASFAIIDEDADELEWYVPTAITPSDLQRTLTVIDQFLETPIDLEGKKASELLGKKRRRRRRRRSPSPASGDDDAVDDDDEPVRKQRKEKKKKEEEQYKSAQFIEDSDEEYGDIEAFLEKEKAMRERAQKVADASGGAQIATMKAHGTKKRRRKAGKESENKKRRGEKPTTASVTERDTTDGDTPSERDDDAVAIVDPPRDASLTPPPLPPPRPKPRPLGKKAHPPSTASSPGGSEMPSGGEGSPIVVARTSTSHPRRTRLVISDEDDD